MNRQIEKKAKSINKIIKQRNGIGLVVARLTFNLYDLSSNPTYV